VRLLLEKGRVEPDSKESDGRTPLSSAAREGNEAVVQLLLTTDQVEPDLEDSAKLLPDIALPRRQVCCYTSRDHAQPCGEIGSGILFVASAICT
jgi:hypothetical protein